MKGAAGLALAAALAAGWPAWVGASDPGWFRVERRDGVWWLVDPAGRPFISTGVDMVNHGAAPGEWTADNPAYSALRLFDSHEAWKRDALDKLSRWGFNTVGAWGDADLYATGSVPFTVCFHLGSSAGFPWTDLWDGEAERSVRRWAEEWTARWRDDHDLIGYFTDNELPWWDETLFAYVLARDAKGHGAKTRLFRLLERAYAGSLTRLEEDWVIPRTRSAGEGTRRVRQRVRAFADLRGPVELRRRLGRRPAVIDEFMTLCYARYGELVTEAVRDADPNHLVLGERYYQYYVADQIREAGRWNDVLSTNRGAWVLDGWVSPNHLAALERVGGRPALIGEFYFAAEENRSGNRNSKGGFPTVATQRLRAAGFANQVRQMAGMPHVVGWHWFQFYDEPPLGRGDGEDYNMGLVDIHGVAYERLAAAAARVNGEAAALHAKARRPPPHAAAAVPEFTAPRMPAPRLDGDLRDWNKPAAWVPGLGGRPYGAPFGDLFLAASPGVLHVAVQYQRPYRDPTFAEERRPGDPWPEAECERFVLALAREDGSQARSITWIAYPDATGWTILRDTGGPEVRWNERGDTLEATLGVPAGHNLKLAALVRSRADAQFIYFGRRPLNEDPDPLGWATVSME